MIRQTLFALKLGSIRYYHYTYLFLLSVLTEAVLINIHIVSDVEVYMYVDIQPHICKCIRIFKIASDFEVG